MACPAALRPRTNQAASVSAQHCDPNLHRGPARLRQRCERDAAAHATIRARLPHHAPPRSAGSALRHFRRRTPCAGRWSPSFFRCRGRPAARERRAGLHSHAMRRRLTRPNAGRRKIPCRSSSGSSARAVDHPIPAGRGSGTAATPRAADLPDSAPTQSPGCCLTGSRPWPVPRAYQPAARAPDRAPVRQAQRLRSRTMWRTGPADR